MSYEEQSIARPPFSYWLYLFFTVYSAYGLWGRRLAKDDAKSLCPWELVSARWKIPWGVFEGAKAARQM